MYGEGDYLYVHYGDLYRGFDLRIDVDAPQKPIPYISADERIKDGQWLHDQDIVYVLTSETVDDLGHSFLFNNPGNVPTVAGTETTIVHVDRRDVLMPSYLNYMMHSPRFKQLLRQYVKGMKVFRVHPDDLSRIEIPLPALDDQARAVALLDSIFNKQMTAKQTNDYLLQLATAMFEGALEIERREESFADIVELEDSKRIPLNSRDREQRKGPYPYYGATSIMGYVDDFLFDGTRVLLGEDGSVITDDGRPVLQYVWGKYWVNNHAHILKPSAEYSLEMLYIALSRTSIPHIVTGAVQKKISQKNLNTLVLEMPNPQHMEGLGEIFSLYRANVDQNKQLERLRDTLLPKLMSGEIDVSQVELPTLPNNHLSCSICVTNRMFPLPR